MLFNTSDAPWLSPLTVPLIANDVGSAVQLMDTLVTLDEPTLPELFEMVHCCPVGWD